jgi:hypothetical protein
MWFVKPLLSVGRFVISIFAFVVSRRNLVSNNDIIIFMTPQDWAALILSIASIFAIVAGGIKWLVKHYLNELKPNSGSSLKDAVNRLEARQNEADVLRKELNRKLDHMYDILIDFIASQNAKKPRSKTKD